MLQVLTDREYCGGGIGMLWRENCFEKSSREKLSLCDCLPVMSGCLATGRATDLIESLRFKRYKLSVCFDRFGVFLHEKQTASHLR